MTRVKDSQNRAELYSENETRVTATRHDARQKHKCDIALSLQSKDAEKRPTDSCYASTQAYDIQRDDDDDRLTSYRGRNIRCKVDARQTCRVPYMLLMLALESLCCDNAYSVMMSDRHRRHLHDVRWIHMPSLIGVQGEVTYSALIGVASILSAGVHFLPKKLTTFFLFFLFFSRRRLNIPPNQSHPPKTPKN